MSFRSLVKTLTPMGLIKKLKKAGNKPSPARTESNAWLKHHCKDITGTILSIGSGSDADGEGGFYKDYFKNAASYSTSDVSGEFDCDLVIDIRAMPEIEDGTYDCLFCSGVLEHVDDFQKGFREITRILKKNGTLLLGLPFRQPIHMGPEDFWRFTEFGIRYLLKESFHIQNLTPIDNQNIDFPAAYWVKAEKV